VLKEPESYNNRFKNKSAYLSAMRTLTINLPSTIDLGDREAKMALASKLYELGKLTLGQAAELTGYSKETFMELLADYGVSLINYPPSDIIKDAANF